jgi:hypothetical protein
VLAVVAEGGYERRQEGMRVLMMDPRPAGLIIAMVGAVGTAVAALADPLGIGEGNVFGWLQLTGVIIGGAVTLLGLVTAMEWVPFFPSRRDDTVASGAPQTNIVTGSKRSEPQTNIVTDSESEPEQTTQR